MTACMQRVSHSNCEAMPDNMNINVGSIVAVVPAPNVVANVGR